MSEPLTDSVGRVEFTIQVATYQSRADASALIAQLPDAWVQEISTEGTKQYRVNFRRFRDRNAALRAQWDLEDLGYKGFIQRLYT